MAYELGDNVVGYEEEVLDLIDKGFSKDRPGIMGREILDGDDVQIVAGPKTNAATLGDDETTHSLMNRSTPFPRPAVPRDIDSNIWKDPVLARKYVEPLNVLYRKPDSAANFRAAATLYRKLAPIAVFEKDANWLRGNAAALEKVVMEKAGVMGTDTSDYEPGTDPVDRYSWSDPDKARDILVQLRAVYRQEKWTPASLKKIASLNRQAAAISLDVDLKKKILAQAAAYEKKAKDMEKAGVVGTDASDVAAVALGVPLGIAAVYGIYKAGSALTSDSGPSTSKPWLYKLGPKYWTSTARQRQFMRAEKEGGVADVEKTQELQLAERAYRVTEAARGKESKLQKYQRAIEGKEPLETPAPAPAAAAAPEGGSVTGEDVAINRDAAILSALKKAGVPITANSYLGPAEMMKATNIVANIAGPESARPWMVRFMQRQAISYGAPDGSVYEIQNGKPTLVSPSSSSADVSMPTNAPDTRKSMRKSSTGFARSPWEKGLGNPTARSLAMSTMMPTTGVRGEQDDAAKEATALFNRLSQIGDKRDPKSLALKAKIYKRLSELTGLKVNAETGAWEKTTMDPTARSLAMSTVMPTTGVRGGAFIGYGPSPWEKGLADPTARNLAMSTVMPTTGVRGAPSPWEKGLSDPTARSLAMSTVMPTTGVRGAPSPWEKGLSDPTARSLAMSTMMPTTGVRGAQLMGAAGPSPMEAKVLNQVIATHGGTIAQIVNAKNLGMKRKWSPSDVDIVAAGLLQKMNVESGRTATAADANIARAAVRFWLVKAGGSISGAFIGGAEVGSFWSGLATAAISPITVPYWLGKKAVQGTIWAGRKVFGHSKGPSPSQQRQSALAAAAKKTAAAQLRIQAAEKRQEAALMENEQAKDVADQEAKAMEAEAAAQAAESVAITTEATKDVAYTPEAVSGWTVVGHCPPAMVGKAALAAATDTPVGRRLRIGAFIGRAMRTNPVVRKQVAAIVGAAKAGDPKAKHQVKTIKAGMIADKQKNTAVKTNAMVARTVATHEKRKLLALGGSPIGMFSRIRVPSLATMKARAWSPFSFGSDVGKGAFIGKGAFVGKGAFIGKGAFVGKGAFIGAGVPPAIPGIPADIMVALTASSNTFGIPPAVAASVIAAAKSGDPKARKELNDAARVYKAAQKGDPVARKQLAAVAADMKTGYAPAAEKAAVMSAAIGATKGKKNFDRRQKAQAAQKTRAVAAAVVPAPLAAAPCTPIWKCPISFGGRTLWS